MKIQHVVHVLVFAAEDSTRTEFSPAFKREVLALAKYLAERTDLSKPQYATSELLADPKVLIACGVYAQTHIESLDPSIIKASIDKALNF